MTAFLKVKLAIFGGYWRFLDGIGAFSRTLVFDFVILEIKVFLLGRICNTLTPYRKPNSKNQNYLKFGELCLKK
jgi:hypothetical protein